MLTRCGKCGQVYSTRKQWNACPHLSIVKSIIRNIQRMRRMRAWAFQFKDAWMYHTLWDEIQWWKRELRTLLRWN